MEAQRRRRAQARAAKMSEVAPATAVNYTEPTVGSQRKAMK